MPDDAEQSERTKLFTERFRYWLYALFWIVDVTGCTAKAAFLRLGDAISCGDVRAVDGHEAPVPRKVVFDRLALESTTSLRESKLCNPIQRCG